MHGCLWQETAQSHVLSRHSHSRAPKRSGTRAHHRRRAATSSKFTKSPAWCRRVPRVLLPREYSLVPEMSQPVSRDSLSQRWRPPLFLHDSGSWRDAVRAEHSGSRFCWWTAEASWLKPLPQCAIFPSHLVLDRASLSKTHGAQQRIAPRSASLFAKLRANGFGHAALRSFKGLRANACWLRGVPFFTVGSNRHSPMSPSTLLLERLQPRCFSAAEASRLKRVYFSAEGPLWSV